MAYGVKWRLEFTDELGRDKRADILKKDYTGAITEVTGAGFSPLFTSIQNQGDPKYETVRGTEIELRVYAELQNNRIDYSLSNETIFWVEEFSTELNLVRCDFNDSTGAISNIYERLTETDLGITDIARQDSFATQLYVLDTDYVVLVSYNSQTDTYSLHLLDDDFALIGSETVTNAEHWGSQDQKNVTQDEQGNFYAAMPSGTADEFRVKKYNQSFDTLWASSSFDHGEHVMMVAGVDNLIVVNTSEQKTGPSTTTEIRAFNKNNGTVVNSSTLQSANISPQVQNAGICVIPDKKVFFTLADGTGADGRIYVATEDLNTINYVVASTITDFGNFAYATAKYPGGNSSTVYVARSGNDKTLLLYNYETQNVLWKIDPLSMSVEPDTVNAMQDGRLVIGGESAGTSSIYLIDPSTQTEVVSILSTGTQGNDDASHKMRFENWQLRDIANFETEVDFSEIITGTDTEYKIEIYEEAAAS